MKPCMALRALSIGETKRCRRRLLISALRGVLYLFLRLSSIVRLPRQIARQNCACTFKHRTQRQRLGRGDGGHITLAALRCLTCDCFQRLAVNEVCFIEDGETRNLRELKLAEDSFDRFELLLPAGIDRVNEVYQQIAIANLFERGAKGGEQIGRQVAYESDRVVDDDFLFARQAQPTRSRVERGEHSLLRVNVARSERVQKRRLARVGIADNRDDRKLALASHLASFLPALRETVYLFFEAIDSIAHAATVCLKFRFTRPSSADAAREPRKGGILSGNQARQQVFHLRQLYLNLAFARLCALGKDVEDELRAVNNFEVGRFGERTNLSGL